VLSISILRAFGRSTILENNIVQTTGSAGESLAAGVMFTIPALIFLGFGSDSRFGEFSACSSRRLARRALHGAAAAPTHR